MSFLNGECCMYGHTMAQYIIIVLNKIFNYLLVADVYNSEWGGG